MRTHKHTHKWWRNMAADQTAAHMLTQNHLHPTLLINFCHFSSSPPTVTSEDGKLFIALKRSCSWKLCTSVVDVVLIDCSGIVHLKRKVLSLFIHPQIRIRKPVRLYFFKKHKVFVEVESHWSPNVFILWKRAAWPFFKTSLFWVPQNKVMQVWNDKKTDEWWQNLNYFFNECVLCL